ncbi:MAG: polyprenyl synthetase family protein [Elusimicrobia bacterium]|nr:polyprenyl synthetase family protein [Elusimicrobiota bacterium]
MTNLDLLKKRYEAYLKSRLNLDGGAGQAVSRLIINGGKRLRSRLLFLSAQACGTAPKDSLLALAAAVEFIHGASLLHDDVLDGAKLRRGADTAHKAFGTREAILGGDFLLTEALSLLLKGGGPSAVASAARAAVRMVRGEALELDYSSRNLVPSKAAVIKIAGDKTASLFCASAELGAIASKAGSRTRSALAGFGELFGLAFQYTDDILDIEGSEKSLGKGVGLDFREGIATLPLVLALEGLKASEKTLIMAAFGKPDCAKFPEAIRIIRRTGCPLARRAALLLLQRAEDCLAALDKSAARDNLQALVISLRNRKN